MSSKRRRGRRKLRVVIAAALAALAAIGIAVQSAPASGPSGERYTIVDLGTLGGTVSETSVRGQRVVVCFGASV